MGSFCNFLSFNGKLSCTAICWLCHHSDRTRGLKVVCTHTELHVCTFNVHYSTSLFTNHTFCQWKYSRFGRKSCESYVILLFIFIPYGIFIEVLYVCEQMNIFHFHAYQRPHRLYIAAAQVKEITNLALMRKPDWCRNYMIMSCNQTNWNVLYQSNIALFLSFLKWSCF